MGRRRCAIFDLDGTLVDSQRDIAEAGNHARAAIGLPALALDVVVKSVGDGASKLIDRLTPDSDPAARERAFAAFRIYYDEHCCERTKPYPAVIDTLDCLARAGWKLAVVTNKPLLPTSRILKQLGLERHFGAVRGGDAERKPDPRPLLSVLHEVSCAPADSWMIGDHHTDIRAGRNAGCKVMFCSWGYGHNDGLQIDAKADAPSQIAALLA